MGFNVIPVAHDVTGYAFPDGQPSGQLWYVDALGGGSDTPGSGGKSKPYRTLMYALQNVKTLSNAGQTFTRDVILIKEKHVEYLDPPGDPLAGPQTLVDDGGPAGRNWGVQVVGCGEGAQRPLLYIGDQQNVHKYVELDGHCTFRNLQFANSLPTQLMLFHLHGGVTVQFYNCAFYGPSVAEIFSSKAPYQPIDNPFPTECLFENCQFFGPSAPASTAALHALRLAGKRFRFIDCNFYGAWGQPGGAVLYAEPGLFTDYLLENCRFDNTSSLPGTRALNLQGACSGIARNCHWNCRSGDLFGAFLGAAGQRSACYGVPLAATLAAAGATQQTAAPLAADYTTVTQSDGAKGVALPPAPPGFAAVVMNTVPNQTLKIYPAAGGQIDALGPNAPYTLPGAAAIRLLAASTTQWLALPVD